LLFHRHLAETDIQLVCRADSTWPSAKKMFVTPTVARAGLGLRLPHLLISKVATELTQGSYFFIAGSSCDDVSKQAANNVRLVSF
jgi:hypothetical protein